jgi:NADH:ubiquinone oxidoreductase subunit 5 (subunit L)/multisubunit Na+/H+ antiporter MnhA subunit
LEKVWRWDDFYDFTIGRPLQRAAQFGSTTIEPKVLDGAVVATAVSVRKSAEGVRKIQSGFVRHYALVVVVGMMLVVLFLVARSW